MKDLCHSSQKLTIAIWSNFLILFIYLFLQILHDTLSEKTEKTMNDSVIVKSLKKSAIPKNK